MVRQFCLLSTSNIFLEFLISTISVSSIVVKSVLAWMNKC